jgi:predicted MFS family arabinose efflux permease
VTERRLTTSLTIFMAVATGVSVANLYYLQPLLHQVKGDFRISTFAASALVTLTQAGFAAGLAFVVPLGDLLARRRLVVAIFVLAAATMVAASRVHDFTAFAAFTFLVGLTSVGCHVLVPFSADLADEGERGRVVARLMTGLLIGVLLSRTFSGVASQAVGWRGVYVTAAVLLAVMALVLSRVLPDEVPRAHVAYATLVAGPFRLLHQHRELRRRSWLGATCFAGFSALWTTLAFHLSAAPFYYSPIRIGLFGLLGVGGVLAANVAGRLADRQRSRSVTIVAATLVGVSFAMMWVGRSDLWVLALAIFLQDAGMQGMQITNQAIIYTVAPTQRSRTNSAYMVCFFTGGAVGSLAGGFAYAHWGWTGSCVLGLVVGALALGPATLWRSPAPSAR